MQRRLAYKDLGDCFKTENNYWVVSVKENKIERFWFPREGIRSESGDNLIVENRGKAFYVLKNLITQGKLSSSTLPYVGKFYSEIFRGIQFLIFSSVNDNASVAICAFVDALSITKDHRFAVDLIDEEMRRLIHTLMKIRSNQW